MKSKVWLNGGLPMGELPSKITSLTLGYYMHEGLRIEETFVKKMIENETYVKFLYSYLRRTPARVQGLVFS